METYIIEEYENQRIDKVVGMLREDISRTTIQRMIEEQKILVNEKPVKVSYKLNKGDKITIRSRKT